MKIGIVGSRTFNDYKLLALSIIRKVALDDIECIVSGGAAGADTLAERFAEECKKPKKIFLAEWAMYGKKAGFMRNKLIVENSDYIFAFWDGKSKGTANTISIAKKLNKLVEIINFS